MQQSYWCVSSAIAYASVMSCCESPEVSAELHASRAEHSIQDKMKILSNQMFRFLRFKTDLSY